MKIFAFLSAATALLASSVQGQQYEACPANITGILDCRDSCGGDEASFGFAVFARAFTRPDNSTGYDYAGFDCECAESNPPVLCSYTYDFPTCQDVGVANCANPPTTCNEYCQSLTLIIGDPTTNFCARNEAVSPPWTSCSCPAPFLEPDLNIPGNQLYVCGDPGYQDGLRSLAAATQVSFAVVLVIGTSIIASML